MTDEDFCKRNDCYHGESFHDGPDGQCSAPDCECPEFV